MPAWLKRAARSDAAFCVVAVVVMLLAIGLLYLATSWGFFCGG